MILFFQHTNDAVHKVSRLKENREEVTIDIDNKQCLATFLEVCGAYPDDFICWVHANLFDNINRPLIISLSKKQHHIYSYNPTNSNTVDRSLDFVEDSIFMNIDSSVRYPSWQMSTAIGGTHTKTINSFHTTVTNKGLVFHLNSLAKCGMPQGLFCYSDPSLLLSKTATPNVTIASAFDIYSFVQQHYKKRWILLLFIQRLLFENKLEILKASRQLLFSKKKPYFKLEKKTQALLQDINTLSIDVIIPTMGRKRYLHDVLIDLKSQSHVPAKVIIIEQDEAVFSTSQLDYLQTQNWPFKIEHRFIHITGACNARNMALDLVESEFVFFADDDIRFDEVVLQSALNEMVTNDYDAVNFSCLQEGEKEQMQQSIQWVGFGSGTSIVKSSFLKGLTFDMAYEHGHGEDNDFGMQLRSCGCDVIYIPQIKLTHLKAPVGGFRKKKTFLWQLDEVTPKPSPTVMYYKHKYLTQNQLKSYKFQLFLKYYRQQSVKNPMSYYKKMQLAWKRSIYWSKKLPL